jgi:hypothetical protein
MRVVGNELKRVSKHKHAQIRTTVWNKGVTQRLNTMDLYKALSSEYIALKTVTADMKDRIEKSERKLFFLKRQRVCENLLLIHVQHLCNLLDFSLSHATRFTIDELTHQEWQLEMKAQEKKNMGEADIAALERLKNIVKKTALMKKKQMELKKKGIRGAAYEGAWEDEDINEASIAQFTRAKHTSARTEEEKSWVALDVLIHPHRYAHVTEEEAEIMKYDKGYHVWRDEKKIKGGDVEPEDVIRILALPNPINLALPFLFTMREIEIHRL